MDAPEKKVWGERRPKDKVTLQIILILTLTCPKTFTQGHVNVCDKYLHWPHVSLNVKNKYIHYLHLHWIYMLYIWLLTLTHTTLIQM